MLSFKNLSLFPALFLLVSSGSEGRCEEAISFNSEVRPILSEFCFACHGPDEEDRAADLRLDEREPAIDYGAIIEGEPKESLLIERVLSSDPELLMPPPETNKTLTGAQKRLLADWIEQGAEYQKHWAFEPLAESIMVPSIKSSTAKGDATRARWPKRDLDRFVAQTHREKGFRPTEEADRGTWLRRVTFDLTGLPPTLAELDAFETDASEDAYEQVVDRLLSSPAYGERMAVMWLDVARYADTFGYQNDIAMQVWPWREWVIEAFNRNMPYDQFVVEQIAGDLIDDATSDQQLATAFNRLHRLTNEGGSVAEEFRLSGITDRTTTAGTAFLALTMECCRCHDHKFDPIKQSEFYSLSAYFSDIDEFGLYSHFTFAAPTPAMLLYEDDEKQRHDEATRTIAAAEDQLAEARVSARNRLRSKLTGGANELASVFKDGLPQPRPAVAELSLEGEVEGVVGMATRCDGDKPIACKEAPVFGRTSPFTYSLWVNPKTHGPRNLVLHQSRAAEDSAFRGLELVVDEGHPQFSMIHFWPGNALRVRAFESIATDEWTHLAVVHDGSGSANGLQLFVDGQLAEVEVIRDKLTRDIRHRKEWGDKNSDSISLALGARFRDIGFRDGSVDELKVYDVQLSHAEVLALCNAAASEQSDDKSVVDMIDDEMALEHLVLTVDDEVAAAQVQLTKARDAENEFVTQVREIMTMRHYADAPPTHVLGRGEYTNKEEQVTARTPQLAGGVKQAEGDRMDLARWMVDPQNPLTSRVIANRMWHLFFGRGIVVSLEDFGSQGAPPSHPSLLDYLAKSLMDHDWDLHWLCREIVLSSTYRQSSKVSDPTLYERDPQNTWLTRGPKHRLSAEQLRDTVLAASGLLVPKLGGPSVMPYQPAGLWRESGTGKTYKQSKGDGLYRRSMYTFWKRTAPPPTMLTLDATSRESCTPRRELTTTPLQALVFLNDPQYVEASRVLAESLIHSHGDGLTSRWNELFRRLLSRLPSDREQAVLAQLYDEQLAYFQENATDANEFLEVGTQPTSQSVDSSDLAATAIVVQTLFAYDETIMLR